MGFAAVENGLTVKHHATVTAGKTHTTVRFTVGGEEELRRRLPPHVGVGPGLYVDLYVDVFIDPDNGDMALVFARKREDLRNSRKVSRSIMSNGKNMVKLNLPVKTYPTVMGCELMFSDDEVEGLPAGALLLRLM